MGIQRFGSRMRDYATRMTLGTTDSLKDTSIAIIDGPGLAHYIYYGMCDNATGPVTYRRSAEATKAWLDRLEQFGFKIDAILFDGALPSSKKDVRIDRLQNYTNRLQAFKQSSTSSLSSLDGQARKSLPPPPFLVFALVEELLLSNYADVTYVVPGEADPYCIAAAQALPADSKSITIFSDDADLLVYKASKACRIVPFRDLSESEMTSGIVLTCDAYNTSELVRRCQTPIEDLVKPAYFMSMDHHCTLEKAFQKTASSNPELREDFNDFAKSFESTMEADQLVSIRADPTSKAALASRDSRISELVHQLRADDPGGLRMYLPFLSDDPTRASAWNIGVEIRSLAYSILLQACNSESSIQEYKRSGSRIASSSIEPLEIITMASMADELVSDMKRVKAVPGLGSQLKGADGWRYLAMQHTLAHLYKEESTLPSVDEIAQVVMNREARKWHTFHLAAQYQATYYSLRMLRQLLAHASSQATTASWDASFTNLNALLADLPSVSSFFDDKAGTDRRKEHERWCGMLQVLLSRFSSSERQDSQTQSRPKKKAKKQKKTNADDARLVQNPFAMLAD
ncbi:hypothetical protein HII31_01062 [Pseudocercospora fuligena]|uniref:Asteroid domain-containing protein n=1 Tax=Pseudocercospora fuligena TaxID=685502 RepID=A0A8H6RU71_9PEZI|nr:hypothetical protein HII31_01062 [Pseudocercospora fuligena]